MPAERFTKKATTPKLKHQWQHVYDSARKRGDPPSSAIRQANGTVKKAGKHAR